MKTVTWTALAAALGLALAGPAAAEPQGTWTVGVGVGTVVPKDDNGDLTADNLEADVDNSTRPTITVEYFVLDNLGIELLAATPFEHSVDLDGLGEIATIRHLPPTLSLQYHFQTGTRWTPLLGLGVNYTAIFDEDGKGALADSKVRFDNSFGVALNAGIDYELSDRGAIRANVRYIDIDSDVEVDGTDVGEAEIDPFVFQLSYIFKF